MVEVSSSPDLPRDLQAGVLVWVAFGNRYLDGLGPTTVQPAGQSTHPQVRVCWVSSARGGSRPIPTVCTRDVRGSPTTLRPRWPGSLGADGEAGPTAIGSRLRHRGTSVTGPAARPSSGPAQAGTRSHVRDVFLRTGDDVSLTLGQPTTLWRCIITERWGRVTGWALPQNPSTVLYKHPNTRHLCRHRPRSDRKSPV